MPGQSQIWADRVVAPQKDFITSQVQRLSVGAGCDSTFMHF